MDKKEINSPKLTEHFLFWVCGIRGLLLCFSLLISSGTFCETDDVIEIARCPIPDVLRQGWDSTDVSCLGFSSMPSDARALGAHHPGVEIMAISRATARFRACICAIQPSSLPTA